MMQVIYLLIKPVIQRDTVFMRMVLLTVHSLMVQVMYMVNQHIVQCI